MSKASFFFGKKKQKAPMPPPPPVPTVQPSSSQQQPLRDPNRELVRQTDRNMQRAKRDMQRERIRLEGEEKKLINQVKTLGRQGRVSEARMLAKNLVQVRKAKERTYQADARMGAIGVQAKMANTDASMMKVMNGATDIMKNVNQVGMSGEAAQNMVMNYEMETEKHKLNQEMTDEVLDSVLSGGDDIDTGTDEVLNSVLDEIGLEISSKGSQTPSIRPQQQQISSQQQIQQMHDADLNERFQRLENP